MVDLDAFLPRNDMMRLRTEKLRRLEAMGLQGYANDFVPSHSTAQAYRWFLDVERLEPFSPLAPGEVAAEDARGRSLAAPQMALAGRVIAVNVKGKVAFVRIQDRGALDLPSIRAEENRLRVAHDLPPRDAAAPTFQLFFSRAADEVRFDLLFKSDGELPPLLDVGDIIGANGRAFRTNTGEPSLKLSADADGGPALRILTKSIRPLPDKWLGLADKEARYRQRYVDLIVHDDVRAVFAARARIISKIRRFFEDRDYLEVETPMLHTLVGGATARPFETWHNSLGLPLFLRIAPELHLKRLVVGGFERVFEINRCFRNEGLSQKHNPEFTSLEFYQAYATYEDLMVLVEALLRELVVAVTGATELVYGTDADGTPRTLSFTQPFARVSVWEGLERWAGLSGDARFDEAALREKLAAFGVEAAPGSAVGKLQMELFEAAAEPHLIQPTFVTDFPVEVSPLSRRNDHDPRLTDRFEIYMAGFELGNAFSELNDPVDQFGRFAAQVANKASGDAEAMDMDFDYIRALEVGLPPTAGCGIGIDRLVMVLTNTTSIREVILFPLLRPERFGPDDADTSAVGAASADMATAAAQ